MKKLIAVLLACVLMLSVAWADAPDFTDWTWDELVALQHYITMTLMERPEWKEVTVPAGDYVVGVDIPEGVYSIQATSSGHVLIRDTDGSIVVNKALRRDETIGKAEVKEAYTVHLTGEVVFAPAVILGF